MMAQLHTHTHTRRWPSDNVAAAAASGNTQLLAIAAQKHAIILVQLHAQSNGAFS